VAVVFAENLLLVIGRVRDGRSYCVLPGGKVKPGEALPEAAIRELWEETGLIGTVDTHLWTLQHEDRTSHYFLVDAAYGPLSLGGPEQLKDSPGNRYLPQWIPLDDVAAHNLRPATLQELLRRQR
jgi:8-oxo-dGTP diphosphatase